MRNKRFLTVLGVVVLGLAAAGWFGRDALKARYYTSRLLNAAEGDVGGWIEQADFWGTAVPTRLLDGLAQDDAVVCDRCGAALMHLVASWPADDLRQATLAQQLAERFDSLSLPGRTVAFDCATALAERSPAVQTALHQLVRLGLGHADATVRLRAAVLALRAEVGMTESLVPLLKDPAAEVRRVAVLAVGSSPALIADDDLLPWLHDPDAEVRRLCEMALRGRGLRPQDVQYGRLLTHPQPSVRLQLLALLRDDDELDLCAWLQRLSHDPSPAVRAAAARLIGEQRILPLANWLAQVAQTDPDLTVRPIALYHWQQLRTVRPAGALGLDPPES